MTADELRRTWEDADKALREKRLDDADRLATVLVAALEHVDPTLQLPPSHNYGRAVGLLSNVRLNRNGSQAAVDVFEEAVERMKADPPGVRRALVWTNFSSLFRYLRLTDHAASAALSAIREVDSEARALDADAIGVLFEMLKQLRELQVASPSVLPTLTDVLDAAEAATPKPMAIVVSAHEQLMLFMFALGRYRDAIPHAQFMVSVQVARSGDGSAEAAEARETYGLALDQAGDYRGAEIQYRRALKDLRRQRGHDDPSVTRLRQNLAELARVRNDLPEAERQFRQLEEEDRARHAELNERNSQLLINFGQTLMALGRMDEAAERLNNALSIRAAQDGTDSPAYARVLLALGQLAVEREQFEEGEKTLEEAARIYAPVDEQAADHARFESGLAAIHLGDPVEAVRRVRQIIADEQRRVGDNHPDIVGRLSQLVLHEARVLIQCHWSGPLRDRIQGDLEELDELGRFALVDALSSLGDRSMRFALDQRRQWQLLHLSLVMAAPERTPAAVDRAWRFLTRYRGAETTALRLRARRNAQYDPSAKRARIAEIKGRLVDIDLELARKRDDPQLLSERGRLADELADVEFLLAAATSQERLDIEFIGADAPDLHLQSDSAVVAVSSYLRLPDATDSYALFLVTGREPVRLIDLGAAASIDDAVARYREAVATEGRRATPDVRAWRDPGLQLGGLVFDPLRPLLTGIRELRVLADGPLALVPLSTLPTAGGGSIIDDFDITYDVSLAGMPGVLYEEDSGIDAAPVVIGAPRYSSDTEARQAGTEDESEFLAQFRGGARFEPLAGSEEECRAISQLMQVSPLLGTDATEVALTSLRNPEMLHVSTHGFFIERRSSGSASDAFGLSARGSLSDSLERAGLALTGANDYLDGRTVPPGASDGILYGAEIADCDFMRTDLVTLSACQTGLGDLARGDGVQGLQRAFLSAGAKTVVCSVWEVPDAPTRQMFTSFYTRLLAGEPRGAAFNKTVRELAARYPQHPVAWGGFMLLGRTDPLARFTVRSLSVRSIVWPRSGDDEERSPALQAEALIQRAQQQAKTGDIDGSLATLQGGLSLADVPAPLLAQMRYEAAGIQRKAGRHANAARAYEELERRPDLPRRLLLASAYDAGTNFMLMKDWARAIERYSTFLEMGPSSDEAAMARVNRAGAYFQVNDGNHALEDLNGVIDGSTTPPEQRGKALIGRAEYRYKTGDSAAALADVDRVLARSGAAPTEVAGAYLLKALIAQTAGRDAEAEENYDRARSVPGAAAYVARTIEQLRSRK